MAEAVANGADALGVAGGDGSLAVVAAAALAHGIPFVCIPAGTRNHFALDVGVDRRDVVGALDAFTDGVERRIDVARVNGRAERWKHPDPGFDTQSASSPAWIIFYVARSQPASSEGERRGIWVFHGHARFRVLCYTQSMSASGT